MTTPENQAIWSMATGYVAPSQAAWETPEMQAYAEDLPQALVALDQMPYAYREFATFQRARVTQFLVDAIEEYLDREREWVDRYVIDARDQLPFHRGADDRRSDDS